MRSYSQELDRLPKEYTFGIEIEFTGGLTYDETQFYIEQLIKDGHIRNGWTVHKDRSVLDEDGKGAEIVSPALHDDMQTEKEIKIITSILRSAGCKINEKVGGHIHYGLQCLGDNIPKIKNYCKLYTAFEPTLYKISIGDLDSVRVGCHQYAKPIQKRLMNVIECKISNFSELIVSFAINVGANPTHYGENRYYGLNIQRIIESLRNIPEEAEMETFIQKMFQGQELYGKDGEIVSPTVENRYKGGSLYYDDIMCGVRIGGQVFVRARDDNPETLLIIDRLYQDAKKRKKYIFEKVLEANRMSEEYADCEDDEEIKKKFAKSIYGDGKIDEDDFGNLMRILYPNLSDSFISSFYNYLVKKIKPTEYKKNNQEDSRESTQTTQEEAPVQYTYRLRDNQLS